MKFFMKYCRFNSTDAFMKIGNSPYAALLPFLRGPAGPPGIPGEKGEKGATGLLAFDHKLLLMLLQNL